MAFRTASITIPRTILLGAGIGIALILFSTSPAQGRSPVSRTLVPGQTDGEIMIPLSPLEQRLIKEGFVNVHTLDPTMIVDLKYAKADNFMGTNVYGDLTRAYLRPEAAKKLAEASSILRLQHPNLCLLVGDAFRPRSVQRKMWKLVVNTPRQRYVANPRSGSLHNYGAAVDVTLYDVNTGKPLDMGTPFDYFGPLAQPALEKDYLKTGKLSTLQLSNRAILRDVMLRAGWHSLSIEWWHFNAFPREQVCRRYSIIE